MRLRFFLVCVLLVCFTTSCSLTTNITPIATSPYDVVESIPGEESDMFNRRYNTNGEQADDVFEQIIDAIEGDDTSALRELFSISTVAAIDNFDEDINALIDFYEGEMISYKRYGPGSHASKEGTSYTKDVFASFDVTTNLAKYRLAIRFCTIDSENSENLGVHSLYIIKAENSDMDFAYWGNDIWNIGINIEDNIK